MSELLLLATALAHLAPEFIAPALGHRVAAWETVLYGAEATVLWLWVGATAKAPHVAALAVWGLLESLQRAGCRALHPMDRPLHLPQGQYACDAAGVPTAWLTVLAICAVVVVWRQRLGDAASMSPRPPKP